MLEPIRAKHIQLKKPTPIPVGLRDIRNGCVLDLDFGAIQGSTVIDKSGQSNNGTITGAVRVQGMGDLPGLSFVADDKIEITQNTDLRFGTSDFTFAVTILPISPGTIQSIFTCRGSGAAGTVPGWGLRISNTNKFGFEYDDGTANSLVGTNFTAGAVNYGEFVTAVVTVTHGSSARLYLDGVYNDAVDISAVGDVTGTKTLTFGLHPDYNIWDFDGKASIVRIYNRILSAQEIRTLNLYIQKKAGLIT